MAQTPVAYTGKICAYVLKIMLIRAAAGFWNEAIMVSCDGNHSEVPLNKNGV